MADDLIIELELKSLTPTLSGLQSVSDMLDKIGNQLSALKGVNIRLGGGGSGGAAGGGRGGANSNALPRIPSLPSWAKPSPLQNSINNIQQAQQAGNAQSMAAWNARILKALPVPQLPPAQKSLLQRLGNVAMSSRFSLGGGGGQIMPLVGQTLKALGPEIASAFGPAAVAALGPLAAGVAIAGTGLKLLFDAANTAAQSLTTFNQAMITSGGTASEQGRLNSLGGAIGLSPQDLAQMSRTLADRLATSGVAAGMGQKAGIVDSGNPFLQLDKAKALGKAFDYIASSKTSLENATIAARAWGLESVLLARNLNEQTQQQLKNDGMISASIANPKTLQAATMFNAQVSRLKSGFQDITTVIGSEAMQALTPFIELAANGVKNLAIVLNLAKSFNDFIMGPIRALTEILVDLASLNFTKAKADFNDILTGKFLKDPAHDLKDAAASMLQATKQGMTGGGERARGALPSGWNGTNMNMSWGAADASRMGAFGGA